MLIVIVDLYLIIFDLYNMFIFNTVSSFVSITKSLEKQNAYSMQWMDAKNTFQFRSGTSHCWCRHLTLLLICTLRKHESVPAYSTFGPLALVTVPVVCKGLAKLELLKPYSILSRVWKQYGSLLSDIAY